MVLLEVFSHPANDTSAALNAHAIIKNKKHGFMCRSYFAGERGTGFIA